MDIIMKAVLLLSTLSTIAAYITSHTGTNVTFNWTLPEVAREERWLKFQFGNIPMFDLKTSSLVVPYNSSTMHYYNTFYKTRVQVTGFKPSELLLTFVLHNVTLEDAGMYVCRDNIYENIPGCKKLLIVEGKPTMPVITAVKESSAVILSCTSNSTSLPVNHGLKMSYDWRQNNQLILRDNHILTVDQVKTNGMKYSCRAREDGDLESVWSEEQYGPDKVNIDPDIKVIDVMEGDPLTVTCSADCNPHCQVVWLNQDRSVDGNTPTLHWAKTNMTLAEVYTCEVNNIFGRQTRNIIVNVQYPGPSHRGSSVTITIAADTSVFIVVVAVVTIIFMYRYKKRTDQSRKRSADYLHPVRYRHSGDSDEPGYATINIENGSADSVPEMRND